MTTPARHDQDKRHAIPTRRWGILLLAGSLAVLAGCSSLPEATSAGRSAGLGAPLSDHPVAGGKIGPSEIGRSAASPLSAATVNASNAPEPWIDRASLPDLWARLRVGFALPNLDSPEIDRFAERFAAMNWLEKLGPRARRYLYLLVIEAEKQGVPTELALLPIIESGLNPRAQSPAAAAGLCQFIPSTGRRFGLHQSALTDRRMDLACVPPMYEYLRRNAQQFGGDWLLALAAYNWGEGSVAKAVERNARAGLPGDYQALRMPDETRAYVPQLLALKRLILAPEGYGIRLPEVENRPAIDCEVPMSRDIDVDLAARLAGITVTEFRQLNSGIRKGVIPHATHPSICLPFASAVRFQVNVAEHRGRLASLSTYTVASRTTILQLAKRYQTTPDAIRQANGIASGMRLRSGATVLVPRTSRDGDIPPNIAMTAQTLVEPDVPDTRRITIACKRKDSLRGISTRYRVSLSALKRWNPEAKDPLKPGQALVLHVAAHSRPAMGAAGTRSSSTSTGARGERLSDSDASKRKS